MGSKVWTKNQILHKLEILRIDWKTADRQRRKIIELQARALKNAIALKDLSINNIGVDPEVRRIAKALF